MEIFRGLYENWSWVRISMVPPCQGLMWPPRPYYLASACFPLEGVFPGVLALNESGPQCAKLVSSTQGIARRNPGRGVHCRLRASLQGALRVGNAYLGRGEKPPFG